MRVRKLTLYWAMQRSVDNWSPGCTSKTWLPRVTSFGTMLRSSRGLFFGLPGSLRFNLAHLKRPR